MLGPESVVGTMAFLLGLERSATAVCLTEVKCIEIKEAQRETLLKQIPPWLKSMLKDLVGIIKGQNEKYLEAQRLIQSLENKVKKLTKKLEATEVVGESVEAKSEEAKSEELKNKLLKLKRKQPEKLIT